MERGEKTAEQRFQAEVEQHLPRNFSAHMIHGLLGQTGFRIVETPTLLPAYVFHLAGSTTLVGVARACQALGMALTPILGATLIEHRKRVLPMVFGTGWGMRLPLLGVALAGFFLGARANLWAICIFMALFGFFAGMQAVTFSFLVSKVIPVERRGALVGTRNSVAGLLAAAIGVLSGYFIEWNTLGNGYATVFLVAFVLAALGLLSLTMLHEPESPEAREPSRFATRIREVPAMVRADEGYRSYLIARALGTAGRMAVPFYVIYAGKVMHLTGRDIGWATVAYLVAQTASSLLWGLVADRRGFRDVLVLSLCTWTASTLLFMYARDVPLVLLGFVGLGAGLGGHSLACTNLVLEYGVREDLPMRIAVAQTAEQTMIVLAPLLGSVLIESFSYDTMFWTAIALQLVALAVTWLRVEEPRRRPTSIPVAG